MNEATIATLRTESLSTARLASRLGTQPGRIDAMRRAGELLGVRPPRSWEYLYPAWQFDGGGKPLPIIGELVREARAAGIGDARLYEILTSRSGLVGSSGRLADRLRTTAPEQLLAAVRGAATSRA